MNAPIRGIGCSTMGGTGKLDDLDAVLGRFEDLGVEFAELSLFAETLIVGGRALPERVEQLAKICARRKLRYTVHGAIAVNFMDRDHLALHKAVCRTALEICEAVGADVLVQHTGTIPAGPAARLDEAHAQEREALREMGDVAARHGVRLAIENVFIEGPQEYTADPARLARELAAVAHPQVCGTLDFSHAAIHCSYLGLDFIEAIRAFAPQVQHLHVHDSFGRPATFEGYTESENVAFGLGDLHLPLGWGALDWDSISSSLPIRSASVLMLEINRAHWSGLERSVAAARRLADRLNSVAAAAE